MHLYFPKLKALIGNPKYEKEHLVRFDGWLASIPASKKDDVSRVSAERCSHDCEIPFEVVQDLFMESVSLSILDVRFDVYCPECGYCWTVEALDQVETQTKCQCGTIFSPWRHTDKIFPRFRILDYPATKLNPYRHMIETRLGG